MEKHDAGIALAPGDTTAVFEIFIKTTPNASGGDHGPRMRGRTPFGVGRVDAPLDYKASVPGVVIRWREPRGRPPAPCPDMHALWSDDSRQGTRVTWEIEQVADCAARRSHDQLRPMAAGRSRRLADDPLSGLKTLLETGEQLTTPGSLMYAGAA